MRIATWNLEHDAKETKGRIDLQIQRLKKLDPRPNVVLTETRREIDLSKEGYSGRFTEGIKPTGTCKYERCYTAIWSEFPIKRQLETFDPETALCVELGHH